MRPRYYQADRCALVGLLFLLLSLLSGCGHFYNSPLARAPGLPETALVQGVPFYPQEELQCGPAALAMALNWSGVEVKPAELVPEVFTPGLKGSLQTALVGAARRHGRVAYPFTGSETLLAEIAAGNPAVVLLNLALPWYPKWHYAVAIGFDREKDEIILHSGLIENERLSFRVFMNTWKRSEEWGLLVLPPDRLPVRAEESVWVEAVSGLERVDQWRGAEAGYRTALKRWPNSFGASMGLGNSRYSLGDLSGSAEAFRQAAEIQPQNGMPYNNLAHVLGSLGKREEALVAIQRAIELGGPFLDTFRQTLAEIENKRP